MFEEFVPHFRYHLCEILHVAMDSNHPLTGHFYDVLGPLEGNRDVDHFYLFSGLFIAIERSHGMVISAMFSAHCRAIEVW